MRGLVDPGVRPIAGGSDSWGVIGFPEQPSAHGASAGCDPWVDDVVDQGAERCRPSRGTMSVPVLASASDGLRAATLSGSQINRSVGVSIIWHLSVVTCSDRLQSDRHGSDVHGSSPGPSVIHADREAVAV